MLIGDIYQSPRAADYVDADGSVMLLCDGRVLAPGAYPVLEALIGASFGAPRQIPDFGTDGVNTGYVPIGASAVGGYALGAKAGTEVHQHADAGFALPHQFIGAAETDWNTGWDLALAGAISVAGVHKHSLFTPPNPPHGGQPNTDNANVVPPVLGTRFFIKAA